MTAPQVKGCTLIGCTDPRSVHDHHYSRGHLDIAACHCAAQSGEPGVLFELRPARDAAIARAEKAEATITRVEAEIEQRYMDGALRDFLRAVLEGE